MAYAFKLPDIGEGVAEAEIVKWLVAVGDRVSEDQPLAEVLTDKATVEIPSPKTGRIARLGAAEGEILKVGGVLAEIEVMDAAAGTADAGSVPETTHTGPTTPSASPSATVLAPPAGARVEAVPAARALAKEKGLDLARIAGSGPNGRITLEDVQRAAAAPPASVPATAGETRVPLRGLRRKIAEHMEHAARTIPHFTFVAECDMSAVVEARRADQAAAQAAGVKLTYLAYVIRAVVQALAKFPYLNARFDDAAQEIVLGDAVHLGIATATEEGLTVPVMRDAQTLGLLETAREVERLAAGARAKRLALEELSGGTFTITTTGALGGLLATPIIHAPQVAILGVHEVKPKPVVKDGQVVAREMTNLSLSLDHRVVDGQMGAEFLYAVIENLQHPERGGKA